MNKKILIIIIAVVVIAVAAVLYLFVFSGEKPIVYSNYSPGEYFVVNVKDSPRLFKAAVVLVLDTADMEETLTNNNALIRDTIIFILRDYDENTLRDRDAHLLIRDEICATLNQVMETEHFVDVYFNDYVIQ